MDGVRIDLERFIERLPLGIMVLGGDLQIELRNEIAFTLLDVGMESLLSADFLDIAKDHGAVKDCVLLVRSGSVAQERVMFTVGEKCLGCMALQAGDIIPGGIIVLIEDVSNLNKIEYLKREFIGTLLHKIRSPLATLKTSFSMLNHEIAHPDQKRHGDVLEIIGMCTEEIDRLSTLVGDMRDLFLIETKLAERDMVWEDFPVNRAIVAAIETLKKSFSPEIINNRVLLAPCGDIHILADFEKIKKIFIILIKNGLLYSGNDAPVEISLSNAGDSIEVTIKDRGIGITDSIKNQVFEKYFRDDNDVTRSRAGNGLGLFIAKSYTDLM
jgi:signal transduction histidine kinase